MKLQLLLLISFIFLVTIPLADCIDADVKESAISVDGNVQAIESATENVVEPVVSKDGDDKKQSGKQSKKKKEKKGRKSFDMDAIEKEWQKGDADEELENEFDHIRKVILTSLMNHYKFC